MYTSVGSDLLLEDWILLNRSIQEGYHKFEVHLVDPLYKEWTRRINKISALHGKYYQFCALPSVKLLNSCVEEDPNFIPSLNKSKLHQQTETSGWIFQNFE